MAGSGAVQRHPDGGFGDRTSVKLEIEDQLEEEVGPYNKRMKHHPDQVNTGTSSFPLPPDEYDPLNEPSPLGLRLRKSPSLLELIQMKLSHGSSSSLGSILDNNSNLRDQANDRGGAASAAGNDKLKASNFSASLLRIGSWEYTSTYEGDLVAKCYFAKHKLVWEILQGGLKSKIEIRWSDIMGLKATLPEEGPSTMTVVLARQPLFYRETNPQPRKHTLWQATADFTNGQASLYRQHFLQVPEGLLSKHFEKLIQCDMRLNYLSRQPEIALDSPIFESQLLSMEDPNNSDQNVQSGLASTNTPLEDPLSPSILQMPSANIEQDDSLVSRVPASLSLGAPSPSSVMDISTEGTGNSSETENSAESKNCENLIVRGLRPSLSMTDLVIHLESCISGQGIIPENQSSLAEEPSESHKVLEDIAQHLLDDSGQLATCTDEKYLMARVNSLCNLLQKDGTPVQSMCSNSVKGSSDCLEAEKTEQIPQNTNRGDVGSDGEDEALFSSRQGLAMSRKDSYGDLLLSLPRIASLPQFLFDISEDGDGQTR